MKIQVCLVLALTMASAAQTPTPLGSTTLLTQEKIAIALGFTPTPSGTGLPLTGGTLTGPLTLSGDPATSLQPATKNYVDVQAGCPLRNATQFCITNSTYNAYASPFTTATTTFAAGTSGAVTSCALFTAAGTEVYIPGAGASGAPYVGKSVSCTANTLTVTPATTTSMNVNALVIQGGTTATGTFGVGTSGPVASCATFSPNQGILIPGAGAAAANYYGTVVSCSGTTLTVTPATSTSVGASTVVQHDETAAFQSAITFLGTTGGTVFAPDGVYLVNGPLQDTGGANAVLTMPAVALAGPPSQSISIKGLTRPVGYAQNGGAIILTGQNTGNFIGGFLASGPYGGFIGVNFTLENIRLRSAQSNPGVVMVNATFFATAIVNHVWIDSVSPATPGNTTGAGIYFPAVANNVSITADDMTVLGFYSLARFGEHFRGGSIYGANGHNCWTFDPQLSHVGAVSGGESNSIAYLWSELCDNMIVAGTSPSVLNIQVVDAEVATTNFILDPSNFLQGVINYSIPYNDGRSTSTTSTPRVTGGANLKLINLQFPNSAWSASAGPQPSLLAGLIENWQSQEGRGTSLINNGFDFNNPLVATSVTWTSPTGFTGTVATYNGTTSFSKETTLTNTNFDGTNPFSACVWFNATSTVASDQWLINNLNLSIGAIPGWGLELGPGAGMLNFYIVNTMGSNAIAVNTPAGIVTTGLTSETCVTYDGSKTGGGVAIYLNGVAQTLTIAQNNLTGSAASGLPLYVGAGAGASTFTSGASFSGPIGRVRIYNRKLAATEVSSMYSAGPSAF